MKTLPILCLIVLAAVVPSLADPGAPTPGTVTVYPEVLGTVTRMPVLNQLFVRDTGRMLVTCFETTLDNLEFNRGFVEFDLGAVPKHIVKATLVLTRTTNGQSYPPPPPDTYELAVYPADLAITRDDYDAPVSLLATFVSDHSEGALLREFPIDVTDAVRRLLKGNVGFRVKLQIDPAGGCPNFAGDEFNDVSIAIPRLELEVRASDDSTD